ncbi:DegV family protein [Mycoplasmopsis meleagridis]|uniref:DegV family protein n=1 Tax=Mycoplasmopsis meleagridis TaxID=29561 RepID=UPI00073D8A6C|nr:DegV family protein [Mycoplasmopsis meleagridis]KUH47445.1 fatty acid-binding protein DegV [Mycoplasmopsis meleagridis]
MKYAIIVDSSCGLTKEEAEQKGWYFLPLHIIINGKEYRDGIDINGKNLFDYYTNDVDAKTSAINIYQAQEMISELSSKYDKVIIYPISKYLSGTYQMLSTIANEFSNVKVIESKQIVQLILLDLIWLENKIKENSDKIDEYIDFIEKKGFRNSITLIPKYNKYLVKGGRLHPSAALVAKMLSIVPLIAFDNGQLLKEGIGRIFKKAVIKNIESKKNFIKTNSENEILYCYLHSGAKKEEKELFVKTFNETFKQNVFVKYISPVVSIHTGPEAYVGIAIELDKKTKQDFEDFLNQID